MKEAYFRVRGYLSNSALKSIDRKFKFDPESAGIKFGKVVDEHITGRLKSHDPAVMQAAETYYRISPISQSGLVRYQREFYRVLPFHMEIPHRARIQCLVKVKGKLDGYIKDMPYYGTVVEDLKTGAFSTESAFLSACKTFGYFEQGYLYLQLAKADHYFITGISNKDPRKGFVAYMKRGGDRWKKAAHNVELMLYKAYISGQFDECFLKVGL